MNRRRPRQSSHTSRPTAAAWLVIAVTVLAVVGFYTWLVSTNPAASLTRPERGATYFNSLAHGFRGGKLSLDYPVSPALQQLADPYDPALRGSLGLPDASYYRGHYYLYFGPAPVVLAVIPFQIATGKDLPLGLATLGFATAGYLILATLWIAIWRRYYANISLPPVIAGLLVLGLCTMIPSVVRRSFIWEMPIAAGFCFSSAAIASFYVGLHSTRRTRWFAGGSLLLGLAIASRITLVAGTVLPAVLLYWLWREGRVQGRWRIWPDASWWRPAVACGLALGTVGSLLLWYNYARFGRLWEFGHNYQLTAGYEAKYQHFSGRYLWYNFRLYFANAIKVSHRFPYFMPGDAPMPKPSGYLESEWVTAVLPNFPVFAFAFLTPLVVVRTAHRDLAAWLAGITTYAVAISAVLLAYLWSADRYMADFLPTWSLIALLGLVAFEDAGRSRPRWRWLARACWAGAVVTSIVMGVIASETTHRGRPDPGSVRTPGVPPVVQFQNPG